MTDYQCRAARLKLEIVVDGDVTYLAVGGEIDIATADDLLAAGEQALAEPRVRTLVVNMATVTFMSAAGIGVMVSLNNRARQYGQTVVVVEPSRWVSRILELTALTDVFRIAGSTQTRRD